MYLVTGGAGFIGRHLVKALLDEGKAVLVLDNLCAEGSSSGAVDSRAAFLHKDIRTDQLVSLIRERAHENISHIIHLAALPSVQYSIEHPEETFSVNATGTLNMLEAAKALGNPRFVFASSAAIYGDPTEDELPLRETAIPNPMSPYAAQKLAGEQLCFTYHTCYGIPTVALRFFNVYGPKQPAKGPYANFIAIACAKGVEGNSLDIYGDGEQTRDFVYISDIVEGILLASHAEKHAFGKTYNLGTGQQTSVNDIVRALNNLRGLNFEVTHKPARSEPKASVCDPAHARDELGWTPRISLTDGLGKTYGYFSHPR